MSRLLALLATAGLIGWSAASQSSEIDTPVILVAQPDLRDNLYGSSILVVMPMGGDQHIGFIVNRPTEYTVGADRVFAGGPVDANSVFALVHKAQSPGGNSFELLPDLYVAHEASVIERLIESEPASARLVAGLVVWQPGELRQEMKQGAWFALAPDAAIAMRNPQGLWEELQRIARTI
jgi:putative transcriptional regulator